MRDRQENSVAFLAINADLHRQERRIRKGCRNLETNRVHPYRRTRSSGIESSDRKVVDDDGNAVLKGVACGFIKEKTVRRLHRVRTQARAQNADDIARMRGIVRGNRLSGGTNKGANRLVWRVTAEQPGRIPHYEDLCHGFRLTFPADDDLMGAFRYRRR